MMSRPYAGIGARKTPPAVLTTMTIRAHALACEGMHLRSGGASGADLAWEAGARAGGDVPTVFRPEDCTPEALRVAREFMLGKHWSVAGEKTRLLFGRNAMIVLGRDLDDYAETVVCWTLNGADVGGTGHSVRIARAHGVDVVNWGDLEETRRQLSLNLPTP